VSYGYSFEDSLALLHGHAPGEGLTRSHSIVGALSMAICQWDSKFTVWATGVSSLLWWKVLEERKKFSMPTTTNTPTPRCALCCPRWEVLVRRSKRVRPSGLVPTTRFAHCVYFACLRSRCRYRHILSKPRSGWPRVAGFFFLGQASSLGMNTESPSLRDLGLPVVALDRSSDF